MNRNWLVTSILLTALGAGCSGKKQDIARAPSPPSPEAPSASKPASAPAAPERAVVSDEEAWFRSATLSELQEKLQDIFFDYDRDDLKPEARSALQGNAAWLLAPYNDLVIEVEGHCDERGTVEYNLSLGHGRSGSVADYLVSMGLSQNRLRTVSFGKERPQCTDARESCWWRNRRAHFRVVSRGGRGADD